MEAKTNAFFALRERLYAAAAAGCAVIREDFRLQRAIEAFQPLSATNPVFGKLYGMCQKLTESEQPAMLLTECIALADAVAVTQSRFQDDTPAAPSEPLPPFDVKQVSWKQIQTAMSHVSHASFVLESSFFKDAQQDPRLLYSYLKQSDSKSERADTLSMAFEQIYGKTLIPLLRDAIDMQNPKSSGQQIIYLKRLGGDAMNELFRSYAVNPDVPQDVRIRAMEALSDQPEYAEDFLNIYRTEKGKIKSASLKCLVHTNSPLADTVLQKLFAKPKDNCYALAGEGNTPLCNAFAAECITKFLDDTDPKKNQVLYKFLLPALANKPDVSELFLRMAAFTRTVTKGYGYDYECIQIMNTILIENLCRHEDTAFHELILTLYEKEPEIFLKARLCVALLTEPENAFVRLQPECSKHLGDTALLLRCIRRTPDRKWRVTPEFQYQKSDYSLALFDKVPESLIDFIGSCVQKQSAIDTNTVFRLVTFGESLLDGCDADEHSRIETAVRNMTTVMPDKTAERLSSIFSLHAKVHGNPQGMIKKAILNSVEKFGKATQHILTWQMYFPKDAILADLYEVRDILPQKKLPAELLNKQLDEVNKAITFLEKQ